MLRTIVTSASILAAASVSHAALVADATVTGSPIGGGVYHYTVTLHNTGTTTVGTLWFSWIPGANFMTAVPTAITSPTGWSGSLFGGAGSASILWQANTAASRLAAGGTLSTFAFNSTHSPADLSGLSVNDNRYVVSTSFVYIGSALNDPGYQFVASVVPAPSGALALGFAPFVLRRSRRPIG